MTTLAKKSSLQLSDELADCPVSGAEHGAPIGWHLPHGTIGRGHVGVCHLMIIRVCSRGTVQAVCGTVHGSSMTAHHESGSESLLTAKLTGLCQQSWCQGFPLLTTQPPRLLQILSEICKSHLCWISRFSSIRPERDMALSESLFI